MMAEKELSRLKSNMQQEGYREGLIQMTDESEEKLKVEGFLIGF